MAPRTQAGDEAPPVAAPSAGRPSPAPPPRAGDHAVPSAEEASLLGFAGSRFAVIDTAAGTLIFDAETASGFGVYGHALHHEGGAWDIWGTVGLQNDVLASRPVTSGDGTRLLVRTEGGVQVVDLANRGALLTGLRGEVRDASLADDGETFAAWTDAAMTVVRVSDGARVSYPLAPGAAPALRWTARAAVWTDATSARIVDRATWRLQTTEGANAAVTVSKDGGVVVVAHSGDKVAGEALAQPGLVEVWRSGETRPAARIASELVTNVVLDEAGHNVAWAEYSGEYGAATHLHTLEVTTGRHHRFASQAKNCTLTHEWLLGIENGELRTDGECSPGCPSLTRQSQFRTYDVATGKVAKQWTGDVERPFNEEIGARSAVGENLAKVFGFATTTTLPMKHHPSADVVLVPRPDALRLVDHRGGAVATLEGSGDFAVEDAHFWPDSGARVLGVGHGAIAVWDAATGERVWASRR
ncbi:MAG TPA: hypothetical protein VLT33_09030 [Labilithrix sp.]|nr:hypothetical protein [Labilithrix sp.]